MPAVHAVFDPNEGEYIPLERLFYFPGGCAAPHLSIVFAGGALREACTSTQDDCGSKRGKAAQVNHDNVKFRSDVSRQFGCTRKLAGRVTSYSSCVEGLFAGIARDGPL